MAQTTAEFLIEQGMQLGIEQGKTEGKAEGKAEGKRKVCSPQTPAAPISARARNALSRNQQYPQPHTAGYSLRASNDSTKFRRD